MRPLYRNLFFALGIAAVWLMVRNLDVTWAEAATAARRAGIWLPACLLLWLVIYLMNAWAWSLIIRSGEQEQQERSVGILVLFKENRNVKENLKILGIMYTIGAVCGIIIDFCGIAL